MERIDLVRLYEDDIDEIGDLFETVYPDKESHDTYWKWIFKCPYKYLAYGIRCNNKLVGYYAINKFLWNGMCVSAMIHPEYRNKGLYKDLSTYTHLDAQINHNLDYLWLFSNEMIHPVHKKNGFIDIKQIKEYRVPIKDIKIHQGWGFYPKKHKEGSYDKWRYKKHPLKKYIYYENPTSMDYIILSIFENRIQIIGYSNIERCIGLAGFIGKVLNKEIVSFWSERELDYPFIMLPTWFMYKNLKHTNKSRLEQILKNQSLYMGMSDVF